MQNLPPQSLDIEESIIASCLFGDYEDIAVSLLPEHFYKSAHQKIYSAILKLIDQDVKPEVASLANILRDSDRLEEVGGLAYLAGFISEVPLSHNIKNHIQIIKEKYALRKMIEISNTIVQKCFTGDLEGAQINAKILTEINVGATGTFKSYRDLAVDEIDYYEDLHKNRGKLTGIATGFTLVDSITCGLQDTDLVIVAGRPGMGKTALGLNISHNAAKQGHPVAIFSLEMSRRQLYARQVAAKSNINSQKFRSGNFESGDWLKINEAVSKMVDLPVWLDDSSSLHFRDIRQRLWELQKKEGIRLVIIDHLQLMRGDGNSRNDIIDSITSALKSMAKDLNIPVVLLSQLNRKLEERNDKRPKLSDLRDSGTIEQNADIIAFIYRDDYYNDDENNPHRNIAELNIAKQRNGPTGMARLHWNPRTTTFNNLAYDGG